MAFPGFQGDTGWHSQDFRVTRAGIPGDKPGVQAGECPLGRDSGRASGLAATRGHRLEVPEPLAPPQLWHQVGILPPLEFSVLGGFIPIPTPTLELCPFWGQSGDNDPCQPSQGAMGGCDLP